MRQREGPFPPRASRRPFNVESLDAFACKRQEVRLVSLWQTPRRGSPPVEGTKLLPSLAQIANGLQDGLGQAQHDALGQGARATQSMNAIKHGDYFLIKELSPLGWTEVPAGWFVPYGGMNSFKFVEKSKHDAHWHGHKPPDSHDSSPSDNQTIPSQPSTDKSP